MKKKMFVLMLTVLGISQGIFAQSTARNQALFVYNFTRYIQWPSMNSQEFVIGVLGKSDIYNELQTLAANKKMGSSAIAVKQYNNVSDIGRCQILFVSSEVSSQVTQLATQFQSKNTLIITERSGLSRKGASICFAIEEGKQKFEISKSNIAKTGLMVNNQLLDMAILTD
jgi:hypothetical protein